METLQCVDELLGAVIARQVGRLQPQQVEIPGLKERLSRRNVLQEVE